MEDIEDERPTASEEHYEEKERPLADVGKREEEEQVENSVVETSEELTKNEETEAVETNEFHSVSESVEAQEKASSEKEKKKEATDALETEMLAQAAASAYTVEEIKNEKPAENNDLPEEELEATQAETAPDENPENKKPDNMTFIQWLKYKQDQAAKKSGFSGTAGYKSRQTTTKTKDKRQMSKKEINELLDKFIQEEPTINKPTKSFFNPSKNAKESLQESDTIVSETLAKIHFMQGNYAKAIAAYQQLSLLYPEKRVFFADQIEKIKEKQSQDS